MKAPRDPVLERPRTALKAAYGNRLQRVVLFGSRARGDARPDSDYDVVVFLHEFDDFGRESRILSEVEADLLFDEGILVGAIPFLASAATDRTGFMAEVLRDGIDL